MQDDSAVVRKYGGSRRRFTFLFQGDDSDGSSNDSDESEDEASSEPSLEQSKEDVPCSSEALATSGSPDTNSTEESSAEEEKSSEDESSSDGDSDDEDSTESSEDDGSSSNDTKNPKTSSWWTTQHQRFGYESCIATTPCFRDNKPGWHGNHKKQVAAVMSTNPSLLLCGDSIVDGLARYKQIWNRYFGRRKAVNCGIGGDRTQHVLWRVENMDIPASVKHVVLHCGTNNIDHEPPREIANGIMNCGLVAARKRPGVIVVVTGLLPRDLKNTVRRRRIVLVNRLLAEYCASLKGFVYVRQSVDWVHETGMLNERLYYKDHLHLVEGGNELLAGSICEVIDNVEEYLNGGGDGDVCEHAYHKEHADITYDSKPEKSQFGGNFMRGRGRGGSFSNNGCNRKRRLSKDTEASSPFAGPSKRSKIEEDETPKSSRGGKRKSVIGRGKRKGKFR